MIPNKKKLNFSKRIAEIKLKTILGHNRHNKLINSSIKIEIH